MCIEKILGARVFNYIIEPSLDRESWLTHKLTAYGSNYASGKGAGSWSEKVYAIGFAEQEQLPTEIDVKQDAITIYGAEKDIHYVAEQLNLKGFKKEN